jgi:hypothetical protein
MSACAANRRRESEAPGPKEAVKRDALLTYSSSSNRLGLPRLGGSKAGRFTYLLELFTVVSKPSSNCLKLFPSQLMHYLRNDQR